MNRKRILVASGNPGKLRELGRLFDPMGIELIAQSTYNIPEADEPHSTFVENALAKAHNAARFCDLAILAEDSGICVDALNGEPGVISAMYSGYPKSDERNNQKLLAELENQKNRKAHYCCVMVLLRHAHDPQPLIAEAEWHGSILHQPRGTGGFGYDPIFLADGVDKTGGELSLEDKNKISHRAQALRLLARRLNEISI